MCFRTYTDSVLGPLDFEQRCGNGWRKSKSNDKLAITERCDGVTGFFGLTRYYRRFVKGYGDSATPLSKLLQKNAFKWNEEASEVFERLKQAM